MSTPYNEIQRGVASATAVQHGSRIAWSGVWSGLLVAVGVFLLLSVLGLAIGISAADVGPAEDGNAKTLGVGAAIWSGLTLLVSLFIGGMVATRTGMVYDRTSGMIEGVLVWVLAILLLIYLASSGIGMLTSGVLGALGGVTRSATSTVAGAVNAGDLSSGNVEQITARLKDPKTAQVVAAATGMTQAETQSTLSGIAQRVEAARNDPAQAMAEARKGADEIAAKAAARAEQAAAKAQPYASATMWTTLLALVLGLAAAVSGAVAGRKQVAGRLKDVATASAAR
ncbi:hypothetical protein [Ramlibacter tataouinensis]|uniref:Candidate membrane protein n=1 Tax=Ramlibacter tataouinensis (strain ATCC BAA-407 / DSM 14655 / LMG 21543 / TTB310) TaxID=365046 RepID=F5Y4L6_RAMTT|nr:hypothetical protein [Ramlibacter tataouinensis]AEG91334.1 candidate membrane protein [Ramlibacter tataouinensis TTB310]